jgi:hypothetical protein
MRRRRSTSSGLDHRGKERYRREKDVIHKEREEGKPAQREVKWRRKKSEHSCYGRPNVYRRLCKKPACDRWARSSR